MIDFYNTLICPTLSTLASRKEVNLNVNYTFSSGATYSGVPVIIANMASTGLPHICTNKAVVDSKISVALHKFCSEVGGGLRPPVDQGPPDNYWHTVGIPKEIKDIEYWKELEEKASQTNKICVDVANGYMEEFHYTVFDIRQKYPKHLIMAGNVCTVEGAEQLVLAGADIVKVGIGPGRLCRTREVTGVGYPQLQAIQDIARAKIRVCADGGIRTPGDACKAFVAGADFVMLGSYFMGCDELGTLGYGMASQTAIDTFGYSSSYRSVEGVTEVFPNKGPIAGLIQQLLGGIRSCCTYTNSKNISDLKLAKLINIGDGNGSGG